MKIKKMTAGLLSLAMSISLLPLIPLEKVEAASDCVVDISKSYQTIQGFGGINLPEWAGSDLTDAQVQKAFGNGEDELGLSILRVYVSDDTNAWSKAVPTAKRAQALGATVFATPWNPPASMRINGDGTITGGKYQLDKTKWAEYAAHLNSYVKYMESQGINLYSISVQNEPDYAEGWTYWSASDLTSFIAQYGKKVIEGTDAKLMSPESFQYKKDIYNSILNNSTASANIGVWGTHFYGTTRTNMDFPALESSGKPIWMTEVYVPNSSSDADTWPEAVDVAANIHNGLVVGNLNAYVWWYIRRSYGPMKENGEISKRGYCMAQYSKFVRPGDVRVEATEQPESGVYVSAYKSDDKHVTLVAVNKGSECVPKFSVSGHTITEADRYRTSTNENLAFTDNMEIRSDGGFYATLPANSVSTFLVALDGSANTDITHGTTGIAEPDENGWYFHDTFEGSNCDWTAVGAADVLTSGRTAYAGSEALLIENRTAAWNGAVKSLNSAAFVPGSKYSFSVNAMYFDGADTNTILLKLKYTDENGTERYAAIAEGTAVKGEWVQLANTSFEIPAGAKNMQLLVETAESTTNFYIDEAIGAVADTIIDGAGASPEIIRGDVNFDGRVNAIDLCLAKRGCMNGFETKFAELAADVDQSSVVDITDIRLLQDWLLAKITEFPVAAKVVDTSAYDTLFSNVAIAASYKKDGENNPLYTQRFGADPGVMEYNGRVYVYMTNDAVMYDSDGSVKENNYSNVTAVNCISSDDLVNWTDHGAIQVAGSNGAATWASLSWAPCAAHKTINGKEKFFLYFCNGANGVSVLSADSPTGPWSDPLGKALITRNTKNCSDVTWLFDPAVFVDDDGTGYLCFGGGIPNENYANPKTARIVKLGSDMISLAGDPVTIDAPYLFEDSGINKIGDKYYYTYCSNWHTSGNSLGISGCGIEYMVADSPLGPYTYGGELFKNIGSFFGLYGNNHHSIVSLNGQLYLFYHARAVEASMGITGNYRSPQINALTVSGTKLNAVTGTMTGVEQIKALNPYTKVQAETMSNQSKGISVSGLGDTQVSGGKGDWFKVSEVNCGSDANAITIKGSSKNGCIIKVCTDSADGKAVAYVEIPAGSSGKEITASLNGLSGTQDLYFIFSDSASVDYWIIKK